MTQMAQSFPKRSGVLAKSGLLGLLWIAALALPGCSGGSSSSLTGGAFLVLKTEPTNNGRIFLNQSLKIFFSNPIDLDSVNFNSVAFSVFDLGGNPVSEQVVGTFAYGKNDVGEIDHKVLEFRPKLPSNDTYTNGGFRPGRQYIVSLVGSAKGGGSPSIKDADGRQISAASPIRSLTFRTNSGTTPRELFLDTKVGGPRVSKIDIRPKVGTKVTLNRLGEVPVEVRLRFNQPLNPASTNVPLRQDTDPLNFVFRNKGRIYLEYDDPELGDRQWIPSAVEMPENDSSGATVVLRPDGVLPNNAKIRIMVLADLEDISGESNVQDASYIPIVGTFQTEEAFASQFDAVVLTFQNDDLLDPEAPFLDPVAEVKNGVLSASFDFEGLQTLFDYGPLTKEVVLNTDFTTVTPKNGPPFTVSGGVFSFRNVEIPAGVTVRGVGPNPMVFLATGNVEVRGHLSVNGGDGASVDTLNSANFPTAGGAGACSGGNGGQGSPKTGMVSLTGEDGFGPRQFPGGGGKGGKTDCTGTGAGAGGGGGSQAVQGDPDYYGQYKKGTSNFHKIIEGHGGVGRGGSPPPAGGAAGPILFKDSSDINNFWGRQVTPKGEVVTGELKAPVGGSGGGGGGDRSSGARCQATTNYIMDEKAGGGGGAGGALVIKALGKITVGPQGLISADGGNGGGGEMAGSSFQGGGGGGGSGGMVVLMSATGIDIYKHGGTWSSGTKPWNSDFAITADGGIGASSGRRLKYIGAGYWNTGRPNLGGFGGMGVVQLMTPPGSDSDGTKNVLDDNIQVLESSGKPAPSGDKIRYLFGGDIRPNPILMPAPFSRFSQARTRWISTGATLRREVTSTGAGPRALLAPAKAGPEYRFAGVQKTGLTAGYLATNPANGLYTPPVVPINGTTRFPVASASAGSATIRTQSAHVVRLAKAALPGDGRYQNYRARLINKAGTSLGDWKILGHDKSTIYLDASEGALPNGTDKCEILAKFFDVVTEGSSGLGEVYSVNVGGKTFFYPLANIQIGFAFHKSPWAPKYDDPKNPTTDSNRFPTKLGTFVSDLETSGPGSNQEKLRALHYPYVQMMVRFNLSYDYKNPDVNSGPVKVGPDTKKPALRFLLLPYRF